MGSGRQSVRDPLVPRYGPASAPGPLALVSDAPAGEGFVVPPLARARVTPVASERGDRACRFHVKHTRTHTYTSDAREQASPCGHMSSGYEQLIRI